MENQNLLVYHFNSRFSQELKANLLGRYNLLFSQNLEEAASHLRVCKVGCIITGLFSEGAPGMEEVLQLRSRFQTIPMIVYSKPADPDLIRRCALQGIQKFVPFGYFYELVEVIPEVIARASFSPHLEQFGVDRNRVHSRLGRALHLITTRFLDDLTISEIASHVGVHRCHLQREFQLHCGISPRQLITGLRLQYAAFLLGNRAMKIKNIARLAHFTDSAEFSKLFRKHLGISPAEFRKRYSFEDFARIYRKAAVKLQDKQLSGVSI